MRSCPTPHPQRRHFGRTSGGAFLGQLGRGDGKGIPAPQFVVADDGGGQGVFALQLLRCRHVFTSRQDSLILMLLGEAKDRRTSRQRRSSTTLEGSRSATEYVSIMSTADEWDFTVPDDDAELPRRTPRLALACRTLSSGP